MVNDIPKSSQDRLGRWLSEWRNRCIRKQVIAPFLDVACGDNRLARSIPGGIGVDVADYGRADLVLADFGSLPFPDDHFSTITIVASLNYFEDPRRVLAACSRVLRPDGRIVLTLLDPQIGGLWHRLREPWAKAPGLSRRDIERLIQGMGLELNGHSRFMLGLNNLYILSKTAAE